MSNIEQFIIQQRSKGIPDVEIFNFLQKKGAVPTQKPSSTEPQSTRFSERARETFDRRGEIAATAMDAPGSNLERVGRFAGQVAGAGFDAIGLGLGAAARGVGRVADVVTAPVRGVASVFGGDLRKPTEVASETGTALIRSPVGQAGLQALEQGMETYNAWKQENPRVAANLEAVVNVGSVLPVGSGVRAGKQLASEGLERAGLATGRTGRSLIESGQAQSIVTRQQFVQDLVQPELTFAVRRDRAKDLVEGGILRERALNPSAYERQIAEVVSQVPGVSRKNTVLENLQRVDEGVGTFAQQLRTELRGSGVIAPVKEHTARVKRSLEASLEGSPFLVGDSQKVSQRMVSNFEEIAQRFPGTAEGFLDARQSFDKWLKSQRPKVFDQDKLNVTDFIANEIRRASNDYLASITTGKVAVKDLLKKQSSLFSALDNMAPKAAREASNKVIQMVDKLTKVLGTRNKAIQAFALVSGLGGLGAAATFAPTVSLILGATGATFGSYRLITSPAVKKSLGQLLQEAERATRTLKGTARTEALDTAKELRKVFEAMVVMEGVDLFEQPQQEEVPDETE